MPFFKVAENEMRGPDCSRLWNKWEERRHMQTVWTTNSNNLVVRFFFFFSFWYFIYLAALGLSCSMQDLSLWCTAFSLVVVCGLSWPAVCRILISSLGV